MQDFYRRLVKEELFQYCVLKQSLGSISSQIKELEERKLSYGVTKYEISTSQPSNDGGVFTNEELKIININSKIELLKKNKENALSHIDRIEKALDCLDDMEKDIVISLHGRRGKRDGQIDILKEKYHYDKSYLYKISNEAIERLSYMLYGDA